MNLHDSPGTPNLPDPLELCLIYLICLPHPQGQPMLDFWLAQGLVERRPMGSDVLAIMQRASSPAEWAKRANEFFNGKQLDMAGFCFERAGDAHNARRCYAAALRQKAERCEDATAARKLHIEASAIYEELGARVSTVAKSGENRGSC